MIVSTVSLGIFLVKDRNKIEEVKLWIYTPEYPAINILKVPKKTLFERLPLEAESKMAAKLTELRITLLLGVVEMCLGV